MPASVWMVSVRLRLSRWQLEVSPEEIECTFGCFCGRWLAECDEVPALWIVVRFNGFSRGA